ncbi:DUF6912 family protein [Boudabousia marimammalium]|uniref:Uncharacterized protein n=1 Tax=Boudabousia marimammalium TaxID=156892 RepID=A0A1Q5PS01_9ACTO|nr:hypothetical protein [Boudabousia marimammalium]OKL50190.1 hypothetical protein BM477_02005 [Boudabousia marimammalium]
MRIYIPASLTVLSATRIEPGLAYAVTPRILALGEEYGYGELECEELASDYAAMASVVLEGNDWLGRRMVVAAEVEPDQVSDADAEDFGSIQLLSPVCWKQVASILIDDEGVETLVTQTAQGDESAWEELSETSLAWYDASERMRIIRTFQQS